MSKEKENASQVLNLDQHMGIFQLKSSRFGSPILLFVSDPFSPNAKISSLNL